MPFELRTVCFLVGRHLAKPILDEITPSQEHILEATGANQAAKLRWRMSEWPIDFQISFYMGQVV
jgi:hypothetical protein